VRSRARINITSKFGTVATAAIADVELFIKAGFEANTSRKNAAAVVNENQATLAYPKTRYARALPVLQLATTQGRKPSIRNAQ
jgi:hypothetical protein